MTVVLEKVQFMFSLDNLLDVAVANNILYLAIGALSVIRIDLAHPTKVTEVQIPRKPDQDAIRGLFVDPSGSHLLAVTKQNECFYLHSHADSFRNLSRLKGLAVSSVAWSPKGSSRSPGVILLGTLDGIYETEIEPAASERYFKRDTRYLKKAASISNVVGVHIHGSSVLAVAGKTLYSWTVSGDYNLQSPETRPLAAPATGLQVFADHFGVLAGDILYGSLSDSLANLETFSVSAAPGDAAFLLSEYHVLVFDKKLNTVTTINLVNKKTVSTDLIPASGVSKVCSDPRHHTFWAAAAHELIEIKLENEQEGMWNIYLGENKFKQALEIAKLPADRQLIFQRYAVHELSEQRYEQAAHYFGLSDAYLEGVAVKLIEANQPAALIKLFEARLSITKNAAQQVMLTSWLVELYLQSGDEAKYHQFLDKNIAKIDKQTVLEILRSHGNEQELLYFARLVGNYSWIVDHYIALSQWSKALKLLREHDLGDVVYKYATVLLLASPNETVESWIVVPGLDPLRLLPALIRYAKSYRGSVANNQAIRYLRHLVFSSQVNDTTVDNTLVSVYAMNSGEDDLLDFLKARAKSFTNHDFALRVCLNYKKINSAIYLYTLMNLYEEAVDLALANDELDEAARIVDTLVDNEQLSKDLWLKIARKKVLKSGPTSALGMIGNLRVEELLNLFPDFETLKDLAPEIVKALEASNNQLGAVNKEMQESLAASRHMQEQIANFKHSYVLVEPGEACQHCHLPLATRPFYVFPCQHGFHFDCVVGIIESAPHTRQARQIKHIKSSTDPAEIKQQLDEVCIKQCPLCSESRIDSVDVPLTVSF